VQLYRELIRTTRASLACLHQAAAQLATTTDWAVALWQAKVDHYRPSIEQIIAQTERRVLAGEAVPAGAKLVSLFEPHADIIRKGCEVTYGHKLNLTPGQSGLILDLVIEAGNPADSERLWPMLERHIALYGRPPRQAAAAGSHASRDNLRQATARGVRDMAFHKKGGLRIEDMVRAAGSTASSGTSAPASRPTSRASSAPTAWHAAPGAGSAGSGPMSGPRSWPTTSPFSRAFSRPDANRGRA
jgi:IS5 family transposase